MRILACLLACSLAGWPTAGQCADTEIDADNYGPTFAHARIDGWRTFAITESDGGVEPMIASMQCYLVTPGIQIIVDRNRIVGVSFVWVRPGGSVEFSPMTVDGLEIGTTRYGVKVRGFADYQRFNDFPYPKRDGDDLILSVFRGYTALRKRRDQPFLDPVVLVDDLMTARSARIGYWTWDEDQRPRQKVNHWKQVSLAGLGKAITWCQKAMASPAAYRLPQPQSNQPP